MSNSNLLVPWCAKTLADNPGLISSSKSPKEFYAELSIIFIKEAQEAIKEVIKKFNAL